MNFHRESAEEKYDVILIGSGLGGLSAAALLAKAGKKILVIERHSQPGGYAHSFRRKNFLFDAAVHLIGGGGEGANGERGLILKLLEFLGVGKECDFCKVDPFYTAIFPEFKIQVPAHKEGFIESYSRYFPAERREIKNFVDLCQKISQEAEKFPQKLKARDIFLLPRNFPTLLRYHRASLEQALRRCITNRDLRGVLAALWPYLGLPPSRLSFLYWSGMLFSYLNQGAYYCRGSFQKLVDALVLALEKNQGELLLRAKVGKILVKNGRAYGVTLENGQKIYAPTIISNADAGETFERLVGLHHLSRRLVKKIRKSKPSISAFTVYAALRGELRTQSNHNVLVFKNLDQEKNYADILCGKVPLFAINIPSLLDQSLAPAGNHLVIITALMPYHLGVSWREAKEKYTHRLLEEANKVLPGFKENLIFAEGGSPRTMERYTLNNEGAAYGWEHSPQQIGRGRLSNQTPITGLYLAGHWTGPGAGVCGVITSGIMTTKLILGATSNKIGDLLNGVNSFF